MVDRNRDLNIDRTEYTVQTIKHITQTTLIMTALKRSYRPHTVLLNMVQRNRFISRARYDWSVSKLIHHRHQEFHLRLSCAPIHHGKFDTFGEKGECRRQHAQSNGHTDAGAIRFCILYREPFQQRRYRAVFGGRWPIAPAP